MTIWTSSWSYIRVTLLSVILSSCTTGEGTFSLLPDATEDAAPEVKAQVGILTSATLMNHRVTVVPPDGYCIDGNTLQNDFVLLAGCGALGAPEKGKGPAQYGLISVSMMRARATDPLSDLVRQFADDEAKILGVLSGEQVAVMQLSGPTPTGTSDRHWRGLTRIGPYLVSMAAFGTKGSTITGKSGSDVLTSLAARSVAASAAQGTKTAAASEPLNLGEALSGLFAKKKDVD